VDPSTEASGYSHWPWAESPLQVSEQQSAGASHGNPDSRQQRFPLVPGRFAARQLPMQQSLSLAHSHCPVLHRLLRAAVHPSFAGAAHVLVSETKPPSPFEPLQLPPQQSLSSVHG
jgi:hypothetical protein